MTAEAGISGARVLNKLAYALANSTDIGAVASNDRIPIYDASGELVGYTTPISLIAGASGSRVVTTTATALSLTLTQHADRVLLVNTNSTVANTFTLPAATGTGARYTVINNIVQTQGTVVIKATGSDVIAGKAIALDTTAAADAMVFKTTATSTKVTYNLTTQGGLGYDKFTAIDQASGSWYVEVEFVGSGSLQTPFAA